jgi:hypothetical protein
MPSVSTISRPVPLYCGYDGITTSLYAADRVTLLGALTVHGMLGRRSLTLHIQNESVDARGFFRAYKFSEKGIASFWQHTGRISDNDHFCVNIEVVGSFFDPKWIFCDKAGKEIAVAERGGVVPYVIAFANGGRFLFSHQGAALSSLRKLGEYFGEGPNLAACTVASILLIQVLVRPSENIVP